MTMGGYQYCRGINTSQLNPVNGRGQTENAVGLNSHKSAIVDGIHP